MKYKDDFFFKLWSPWEMKLFLLLNILDPFYGSHIDSTLSHIHLHYIQCISCDTFNLNPFFVIHREILRQANWLYSSNKKGWGQTLLSGKMQNSYRIVNPKISWKTFLIKFPSALNSVEIKSLRKVDHNSHKSKHKNI